MTVTPVVCCTSMLASPYAMTLPRIERAVVPVAKTPSPVSQHCVGGCSGWMQLSSIVIWPPPVTTTTLPAHGPISLARSVKPYVESMVTQSPVVDGDLQPRENSSVLALDGHRSGGRELGRERRAFCAGTAGERRALLRCRCVARRVALRGVAQCGVYAIARIPVATANAVRRGGKGEQGRGARARDAGKYRARARTSVLVLRLVVGAGRGLSYGGAFGSVCGVWAMGGAHRERARGRLVLWVRKQGHRRLFARRVRRRRLKRRQLRRWFERVRQQFRVGQRLERQFERHRGVEWLEVEQLGFREQLVVARFRIVWRAEGSQQRAIQRCRCAALRDDRVRSDVECLLRQRLRQRVVCFAEFGLS